MSAPNPSLVRVTSTVHYLARSLLLIGAWITFGLVGMLCYERFAGMTPVWPASGLGLAALLLWGLRYWPALMIGSLTVSILTKTPTPVALVLAAANTFEALGAAWVLRHQQFRTALSHPREIVLLAGISAPFCVLTAATGIATLIAAGMVPAGLWGQKIAVWFFGDFLGVLLLAPPLLVWAQREQPFTLSKRRAIEALLLLAGLTVVTMELFFQPPETAATRVPLAFLTFPFVVIAAMRHGLRGGTLATLFVATLAILSTAQGLGVFVEKDRHASTILLMMFEGMLALTALFVGAISVDQRRRTTELHQNELVFHSLAEANRLLLTSPDWRDCTTTVLKTIGQGLRLDRVGLFRREADQPAGDRMVSVQRLDISSPDSPAKELPAIELQSTDAGVAVWLNELRTGNTVATSAHDPRPESRALLDRFGIRSSLATPIMIDGRCWGYLSLSDCGTLRHWTQQERAVAESIATNLGIAIRRDELRQQLADSVARHQALLSAMPDAYFLHDRDGIILDYHTSQPSHLWQPPEKFLGRPLREVFPDDVAELISRGFADVSTTGRPVVLEYKISPPSGPPRHFERRIVKAEGGNFLCIVRDITRERQADIEHARIEQKLREAQKLESLGVLAGGIAHDFNNLLTAILGNAGLARSVLKTSSEAAPMLGQIELAAHRAADLCRQMLAYAGRSEFVVESADLNALVRDAVPLLQLSVSQRARLELDLAGPPLPIFADVTQLRQVLMNLVINSAEAMGPAGGTITLHTGSMHADAAYLASTHSADEAHPGVYHFLEVEDTGCGMDAETLAHIFDPFFTTKFTGRGLGLAAVLGIVRGHRGALHITSAVGQGTTFRILLPPTSRTSDRGPATPAAANTDQSAAPRRSGHVLIVDDEPEVRLTAGKMLEHLGYRVTVAVDGASAVKAFAADPLAFKFILLDLTMPGMDGSQTLAELQRLHAGVTVIAMSGYSETESVQRLKGRGVRGFLPKPFSFTSLIERLDRAGV